MTLPTPGETFEWRQVSGRPALVCLPLSAFAPHLFTTRAWALGHRRSRPDDEASAWAEVARALDLPPARLVRARQVHGSTVLVGTASSALDARPDADVIIVAEHEVGAAVQTADCVPMLVVDRKTNAVAAAHAGWRGMAAGVPRVTVDALAREFASMTTDLLVALGPSIGPCCYEVGDEVRERFSRAGFPTAALDRWFTSLPRPDARNPSCARVLDAPRRSGFWFFDGWAAVRDQLIGAGVPAAQIFSAQVCTASHAETCCSYRRDGAPAGRMVGAIRCVQAKRNSG